MKRILVFSFLFILACHNISEHTSSGTPPEISKPHKVTLEEGLGVVSLSLPARYDTTFSWIHYSDCGQPCERRKYRFQPKSLPVYPETGYHYKQLEDSIEQFTIVHSPYIPVNDSDDTNNQSFITSFHDHKKFEITHNPSLRVIKSDTIEKIGDRYFSIIIIDIADTARSVFSKKVLSTTTIRRGTIDFNFEWLGTQKNSISEKFIEEATYYLRTVRIAVDN